MWCASGRKASKLSDAWRGGLQNSAALQVSPCMLVEIETARDRADLHARPPTPGASLSDAGRGICGWLRGSLNFPPN
jgi:hypothetical protein